MDIWILLTSWLNLIWSAVFPVFWALCFIVSILLAAGMVISLVWHLLRNRRNKKTFVSYTPDETGQDEHIPIPRK